MRARRAALLQAKLEALLRDVLDATGGEPATFPGGAARLVDGRAYVLVEDEPMRALGRALAFACKARISSAQLSLIVEDGAGVLS